MNQSAQQTSSKPIKTKRHRKMILFLLLFIIAASVAYALWGSTLFKKTVQPQQTTEVTKGSIKVLVSGSGALVSSGSTDIAATATGTLTKLSVKEGDAVNAGQVVAELDNFDATMALKKAQNSLMQTQDALASNLRDLKSCSVYAPFDGDVSELTIKTGDTIGKGGSVLTLTDRSNLKVVVSFKNAYRSSIKTGMPATLNVYDASIGETYVVQGNVDHVYPTSYKTSDHQEVYNVRLVLRNNGQLKEGMVANGEISLNGQTFASVSSGTLTYIQSALLKSQAGGTVLNIQALEGQTVKKGTLLVQLDNNELQLTANTNRLKLEQLSNEVTAAQRQVDLTKIRSTANGTVASLPLKVGAAVKSADVIATITDAKRMQFDVEVDELDIAKIKLSQEVSVTIDALPETTTKPLKAFVSKIAVIGTSTNGVTTYPVTITMKDVDQLKEGMNANAEILITHKQDILLLPLEAVQKNTRGSYVMLKGNRDPMKTSGEGSTATSSAGKRSSGGQAGTGTGNNSAGNRTQMSATLREYYAGAFMKRVETGLSDDSNIEIISGLKKGDTVVLPPLSTSSSNTQSRLGGFGGPPGGGAFGGGGGGSNSTGSGRSTNSGNNNSSRSNTGGGN